MVKLQELRELAFAEKDIARFDEDDLSLSFLSWSAIFQLSKMDEE